MNTLRLATVFTVVHALMLATDASAQPRIGDRMIDAEVTTPLYSSARSAAVILKRRVQDDLTQEVTTTRRASLIDETTRWQFVSRESISIEGDLIRLSDVIRPLEPNLGAWPRLSESTIGLMPADGGVAKIDRDRLAHLIAGAKATPEKIKIYGPETIVVQRIQADPVGRLNRQPTAIAASVRGIRVAAANDYDSVARNPSRHEANRPSQGHSEGISTTGYESTDAQTVDVRQATAVAAIDPITQDRLEQWVRVGIRNQFPELHNAFGYDVAFDPSEFGTLEKIQGIRQMTFLNPPPTWSHQGVESVTCRVQLLGRAGIEDCEGITRVTFHAHPAVVTARRSLRRGHRVTTGDLQFEPFAGDGVSLPNDMVDAPDEIVGLEVTGLVRAGMPLSAGMFAAPRVIRRGDLLEVQVGGGGVRVTTSAKALSDGAKGELIEIETLQPKRRLLAKVVHSSLVEIITQAPRVSATTKANR